MKNHVVQAYAPAAGQTQVPYGLGAYTWKSTSAPFNVSDSTRDDAFMGSYNWYAVNGQTASRLGSVGAA